MNVKTKSDRIVSRMKAGLLGLAVASLSAAGLAACTTGETGSVTLNWTAPTRNVDGTELDDLAGYRIYWRQANGPIEEVVVIEDPRATEYEIKGLPDGEWQAGITAFTEGALESDLATVAFTMRRGEATVDRSTAGRTVSRAQFAEPAIAGTSATQ